jgi:hypothetical protein
LLKRIKSTVKEDKWDEFFKSINKDEFPEEYFRKHGCIPLLANLANDYRN